MNRFRTFLLVLSVLCLPALLAASSGCGKPATPTTSVSTTVTPSPSADVAASPSNASGGAASPVPFVVNADSVAPSGAPASVTLQTRLFGNVAFTARPRGIIDPLEATSMPAFQADAYAWTPRETVEGWQRDLDAGTLSFGESLLEVSSCLPPLESATVADVGAGRGNNLLHWKELLGSKGRLIEAEVDINLARFMAYAAHQNGYADQTMVVHSIFENPCLPVGEVDLVLCSQLHNHITKGPWPRNQQNGAVFRAQSKYFLGAIRDALKPTGQLVIIDGYQEKDKDPRRFCLTPDEAIRNIERNGFRLMKRENKPHLWTALFCKAAP